MSELVKRQPPGHWVQTERAAHEAWASLIEKAPKAAQLMHILTARVGEHNAVVVSQKTLAALMKCSRRTVQRAVDVLAEDRWIEIRQIGENGTVNAHIINDRVAWSGKRDGLRYSLFSAAVIISEAEQPDLRNWANRCRSAVCHHCSEMSANYQAAPALPRQRSHSLTVWNQTCLPPNSRNLTQRCRRNSPS